MRLMRLLMLCLLACLSGVVSGQEQTALESCPSSGMVCRLPSIWTLAEIEAEIGTLDPGGNGFITRDDEVTFVYRLSSAEYDRAGVFFMFFSTPEIEMEAVPDSDLHMITLKLQFERYDEALLSFGIGEHSEKGSSQYGYADTGWRGENAPPVPESSDPLRGSLTVISYESEALREHRKIYIYLPPNFTLERDPYPVVYMTDGEVMTGYAPMVDYLIAEGAVPPLVMIGTASAAPGGNNNRRGEEYVPGRNAEIFERHERFFTEEIRERATSRLNVSTRREDNILFGFSNGGLFAAEMSIRHPDLYGTILPFSAGASARDGSIAVTKEDILLPLNVYATAGTLEPDFHTKTAELIEAYAAAGANAVFVERIAGHDNAMWEVEFVNALKWVFKEQGKAD